MKPHRPDPIFLINKELKINLLINNYKWIKKIIMNQVLKLLVSKTLKYGFILLQN